MEIKRQWLVESDLCKREVMAVFNGDEVLTYCDADAYLEQGAEWFGKYENEVFFNTEIEADKFIREEIQHLNEKKDEVKAFIKRTGDIFLSGYVDIGFKAKDYLGSYADNENEYGYYEKRFNSLKTKYTLLLNMFRGGMLNIDAQSFKIDEVVGLKWKLVNDDENKSKYKVTLVLRNGDEITTNTDEEYDLVCQLFGHNESGRIFKS